MDQHQTQIDFIIPAFNAQDTILRTLGSLREQTDPRWNAIVVDDGSTDKTISMVSSIDDPRVRLYTQPNAGPSAARNRGFAQSLSALICFLDADDSVDFRFVECMIPLAFSGTLGASCGYDYVDQHGKSLCQVPPMGDRALDTASMVTLDPPAIMSMVYRRASLEHICQHGLLFDESMRAFEDWDMLDRLVKSSDNRTDHIAQCDDTLAHYWCTPSSLSSSFELVWKQGRALIELRSASSQQADKALRRWGLGILGGCVVAQDHTTADSIVNAIGSLETPDVRSFVESLRWHTMRRLAIPMSEVDTRREQMIRSCKSFIDDPLILESIEQGLSSSGDLYIEQLLKGASAMTSTQGRVVIFGLGRNGMRFIEVADRTGVSVVLADDQPSRLAHDERRISADSITRDDVVIVTPMNMNGLTDSFEHLDPSRVLWFQSAIVVSSS